MLLTSVRNCFELLVPSDWLRGPGGAKEGKDDPTEPACDRENDDADDWGEMDAEAEIGIEWEENETEAAAGVQHDPVASLGSLDAFVRSHALGSKAYELQVEVDLSATAQKGDAAVLDALCDGCVGLTKRFKPLLDEWADTLLYHRRPGRSGKDGDGSDLVTKSEAVMALQRDVQDVLEKAAQLGLTAYRGQGKQQSQLGLFSRQKATNEQSAPARSSHDNGLSGVTQRRKDKGLSSAHAKRKSADGREKDAGTVKEKRRRSRH